MQLNAANAVTPRIELDVRLILRLIPRLAEAHGTALADARDNDLEKSVVIGRDRFSGWIGSNLHTGESSSGRRIGNEAENYGRVVTILSLDVLGLDFRSQLFLVEDKDS